MGFGASGRFPFRFGSTRNSAATVAHQALLVALEPALDPTPGTVHEIEAFVEARILAMIWDAGERLANQANPLKMLEALPVWEEILGIVPEPRSTDNARRAAVAAKLRGLNGNTMIDIEAASNALLGRNFEALVTVDPALAVTYWPGGVPGPPGFEWYSTNAVVAIRVNAFGLDATSGQRKGALLYNLLDSLLPTWMTFAIGVGEEFVVGQSIVGVNFI